MPLSIGSARYGVDGTWWVAVALGVESVIAEKHWKGVGVMASQSCPSRRIDIMKGARRAVVLVFASCAVVADATSASAQTMPDLLRLERASSASPTTVVHEYIPGASSMPGQAAIPSNLLVSPFYRELVEKMLSRSATFRRQVLRIAMAPSLRVRLEVAGTPWLKTLPAKTEFARKDGRLVVDIDITPLNKEVELIAHELEHVIEQLDDVDLAAQAARAHTGVRTSGTAGVIYETTRAIRIGKKVAQEVL
jgi:hypothetical protein